jgi:NTP pyrophosphatase (non-canonical NTP hydrolase)
MIELQKEIHKNAVDHGWWESPNIPEKLLMIHSEVSEAVEDYRRKKMKITYNAMRNNKPEGFPTEIADIVIRCFDIAEFLEIDLGAVIKEKHAYNKTRPYRHGGKRI